ANPGLAEDRPPAARAGAAPGLHRRRSGWVKDLVFLWGRLPTCHSVGMAGWQPAPRKKIVTTPRVILRPRKAQPLFSRHPWVYAGTVEAVTHAPTDGAEVEVVSHAGNFIARGLFNAQSSIRVRLYCWEPDRPLDADFFRERVQAALRLRRDVLKLTGPGRACRLVFSEGDGLSGLTVDQYDRWLVVQFTSLGLGQRRELFADLLTELLQPEGIFLRTERGIGKLEGLEAHDEPLRGPAPPGPLAIEEDGLRVLAN